MSTTSSPPESPTTSKAPIINDNPKLKALYEGLESRIGYKLLLGETRHFGYWEKDTYWVYPVGKQLRRMEEKMYQALDLPRDSKVLDAGCGVAHVALYMAKRGLKVRAIDVTDHHVAKAKRNIARSKFKDRVTAEKMDYHHLETIPSNSMDGAYTMETIVHATDAKQVAANLFRVIRPGGHIACHEYDHTYESDEQIGKELTKLMNEVSDYGAMPTWKRADKGYYKRLLEEAGFVDVKEVDYSENIRPMLRLFWLLAIIPYWFIVLFGLERFFVNAIGGAKGLEAQKYWRYMALTGRKPEEGEVKRTEAAADKKTEAEASQ